MQLSAGFALLRVPLTAQSGSFGCPAPKISVYWVDDIGNPEKQRTQRGGAAIKCFQHRGHGEELTESTEKELRAWVFLCALCEAFSVGSVFRFL